MFVFWLSVVAVSITMYFYQLAFRHVAARAPRVFAVQTGFMWFFIAVAPILHVVTQTSTLRYGLILDFPSIMAALNFANCVGLLSALAGLTIPTRTRFAIAGMLDQDRLSFVSLIFVSIGIALFFIAVRVVLREMNSGASEDSGTVGITIFMFVEVVPLLALWVTMRRVNGFWKLILLVAVLAFIFSGLRGSRVSIAYEVMCALIIIDTGVRHIRKRDLFVMIFGAGAFLFIYAHYKYGGVDGVYAMFSGDVPAHVKMYLDPYRILLGDFGRSDVQAYLLQRAIDDDMPLAFGQTYAGGLFQLLPDAWVPGWAQSKTLVGAQVLYEGTGYSNLAGERSSRIYGLLGEAVINFGLAGIPVAYFIFGLVQGWCVRVARNSKGLKGLVLLPLLVSLPIMILFYDLDNIIFQLIKLWAVPITVVVIASWLTVCSLPTFRSTRLVAKE